MIYICADCGYTFDDDEDLGTYVDGEPICPDCMAEREEGEEPELDFD